MNRPALPAEKNAGMLDGFVGVQQARPDRTNLGPIERSSQNVVPPSDSITMSSLAKTQLETSNNRASLRKEPGVGCAVTGLVRAIGVPGRGRLC